MGSTIKIGIDRSAAVMDTSICAFEIPILLGSRTRLSIEYSSGSDFMSLIFITQF